MLERHSYSPESFPIPSEGIPTLEATEAQKSTARVEGYFKQLEHITKMAGHYADWKMAQGRNLGSPGAKERSQLFVRTRDVFFELYFSQNPTIAMEILHKDHGAEADGIESVFRKGKPTLDERREEAERSALRINDFKRRKVLLKETLFAAGRAPVEQKLKLMELAGSSKEDIRRFSESLKLSAFLVAPLEFAIFAANLSAVHPLLKGLDDPHTLVAILLAYAINAAVTYANYRQNYRAMHTQKLGVSPNILVTYVYTLAKRHFPEEDLLPDLAIKILSTVPIAVPEILQLSELIVPGSGTTAVMVRNITGAIGQAIQAGYVEYLLEKTKKKKEEQSEVSSTKMI